jgi:hypothetical protein
MAQMQASVPGESPTRWGRLFLSGEVEIIKLEVPTLDRGKKAIASYRNYLEEIHPRKQARTEKE